MKKLLLGVVFLFSASVNAQVQKADFPILLKNGVVYPSTTENQEPTLFNDHRYVLIQHANLVLSTNFYGFTTFEYLPKHTAFAKVKASAFKAAKASLESAGGSVLEIDPAWKLSVKMFNQNYPDWAWLNQKQMKTWLRYWPNLNASTVKNLVQQAGFEILEENASENLLAIALNPERISEVQSLPFIYFIQEMEEPGKPENFTARSSVRANFLQQDFNGGLKFDGSGILIAHNDAGMLGNHIDYTGRLTQVGNTNSTSDHGDHTAGTIFGAGNFDPEGEGMAPGADMYYAPYPSNLNNADGIYVTQNARLTSNSFSNGCNAGYTNFSRQLDKDAFDNPLMLHVFSAGNDGGSNCGYGAGAGWGNVTGGHKQGKNVITVANLTRTDGLANSSSRGPANDGRIKPDIGAVGTQVYSTTDIPQVNSYDRKTGTSMSCPGVTGSLALLMQAHKELNSGTEIDAALLKAYLLNGAEDLGNSGPDFRYGYGRMNVKRSYEMLEGAQFFNGNLSNGDSSSFSLNVPAGSTQLKVMLYWADPEASTSSSRNLVNDLDFSLIDGSTTVQPWVLDPTPVVASLNSPAVRGRDSLNNMEQITINNPSAGAKTLKVKGFNIPNGPQNFYVVYYIEQPEIVITYPQPGDALPSGRTELIRFDAPANNTSNFSAQFSTDGGNTWLNLSPNIAAASRTATWVVPNTAEDNIYIRIRSSFDTSVVGPLTVVPVPGLLDITARCPDSVSLSWNSINNASGYVVYQLGAKYMDSVIYVTGTTAQIAHSPLNVDFYAVAAVVNDTSIGYRSIAVEKPTGIDNCLINNDLLISKVLSPGLGEIPDCFPNNTLPVTLQITNVGVDTLIDYSVGFQRQGIAPVVENVADTLAPGEVTTYTFQNGSATLLTNISLSYQYWVNSVQPDGNPFNDTVRQNVSKYGGTGSPINSFPYSEDFESFLPCGLDNDCGFTSCNMLNGWRNASNFSIDAIDFRTISGTTASNSTGPNFDHNPGTSSGNYLYTEASGECDSAEAMLMTPCFDLTGVYGPEASIWYHMRGANMGTLGVDVFDGDRWHYDVSAKISGDQGSQWQELKTDLSAFTNKTIVIRYRGKTGDDFTSDIAIDNFNLLATSGIGIAEKQAANFKVYPNPSTGQFVIEAKADVKAGTLLKVTTLTGSVVLSQDFDANLGKQKMLLDLSSKANGIYLVEIRSKSDTQIIKLIKE
jgi:hypothetical protein